MEQDTSRKYQETRSTLRGVIPSLVLLAFVLLALDAQASTEDLQEPIRARLVDVTLLTDGAAEYGLPLWSPDGEKIAFRGNASMLCVSNSDGSGEIKVLARAIGVGHRKAWSPDSRKIAYVSRFEERKSGPQYQVRVVDVQTGEIRAISDFAYGVGRPHWTRSGGIAYSKDGSLIIADTNGTVETHIAGEPGTGAMFLSHDETKIVYSKGNRLRIMNTDGTEKRALIQSGGTFLGPIFSPDGLSVAVTGMWGARGLYVVDMEGELTTLEESGGAGGGSVVAGRRISALPLH